MEKQQSKKRRGDYIPYVTKQGDRVPNYLVYVPTGEICYRQSFKKLGLKTLRLHTKETSFSRAKTAVEVAIHRHKNEQLGISDEHVFGRRSVLSFMECAEWVLKHHTPKLRAMTRKKHDIYLKILIKEFGDRDVNSIDQDAFKKWVEDQRRDTNRVSFMDYSKHMNLVMRFAYQGIKVGGITKKATHHITFSNPDKEVEKSEGAAKHWRVYTEKEIAALWSKMDDDLKDQFSLSYECFMRKREALHLSWDRVNLKTGKITLRAIDVKTGSKTGKGREFIMNAHTLQRLRARYKRSDKRNLWVFPSEKPGLPVWENMHAWATAKKAAKIKGKATWHSLRHTALTKALLEKRMNPVAVSEYAGVSLATIQRVYLHSKADHTKDVSMAVSISPQHLRSAEQARSEE